MSTWHSPPQGQCSLSKPGTRVSARAAAQSSSPGSGLSNTNPKPGETPLRGTRAGSDPQRTSRPTPGPAQDSNPTLCLRIFSKLPELCQAWGHYHCPGEPVSVSIHPLGEKSFPNIQPKPPAHSSVYPPRSCNRSPETRACPSTLPEYSQSKLYWFYPKTSVTKN